MRNLDIVDSPPRLSRVLLWKSVYCVLKIVCFVTHSRPEDTLCCFHVLHCFMQHVAVLGKVLQGRSALTQQMLVNYVDVYERTTDNAWFGQLVHKQISGS